MVDRGECQRESPKNGYANMPKGTQAWGMGWDGRVGVLKVEKKFPLTKKELY